MFACSRLKLIMNIISCSYLKPKKTIFGFAKLQFYIVAGYLSIIAITGHLAEWMDAGVSKPSQVMNLTFY